MSARNIHEVGVHLSTEGDTFRVGTADVTLRRGESTTTFSYDPEYLARPDSWAISPNTVYLRDNDRWSPVRRTWGILMLGSLHCVARQLSFDDARVRTMASWWQKFEQHLRCRLTMSGVKHLRGKNRSFGLLNALNVKCLSN